MKIELSKLDVARRQLETAIKLFFDDGDVVSIHTLAAASFNVLNDLCRQAEEDKKSMHDEVLDHINEDKRKWYVKIVREAENFMKHADRDPDETHSFDPRSSTVLLMDGVRCYGMITGEQTLLTRAYFSWFMLEHPDIFVLPDAARQILSVGSNAMQGMPKSVFLETISRMPLSRGT